MIEYIVGFLIAIIIGAIAAIAGLGGGFLFVPTLILLFGVDPKTAIGTSLSIIVFSTLSSSVAYSRQKRIFYRSAVCLAIPGIIFSLLGSLATVYISSTSLTFIFCLVLFIVALKMIYPGLPVIAPMKFGPSHNEVCTDCYSNVVHHRLYFIHVIFWGSLGGLMSGLTGIGGGVINVPALTMGGMPVHFAVATSTFVILCTALAGTAMHTRLGHVSPPFMVSYSLGAIIGAQAGVRLAPRIKAERLKSGVAIVLFITVFIVLAENLYLIPV